MPRTGDKGICRLIEAGTIEAGINAAGINAAGIIEE